MNEACFRTRVCVCVGGVHLVLPFDHLNCFDRSHGGVEDNTQRRGI